MYAQRVCQTCSDCSILQDDSVVNKPDVLGGGLGARALSAQQVEDASSQHGVLTILYELTQVRQT